MVIPNGIDTERFRPDPHSGRRLRAEWGADAAQPLIGIVGRLDPMKGHSTFLHAAAILRAKRPQAQFVCVGSGTAEFAAHLRRLADDLGLADRVVWAGERADVAAAYNAFDVHVCASDGEGFPNVLAEAMACGVRCVATDVGDVSWIAGDAGSVVPPGDPTALAGAIEATLASDTAQDGGRGRRQIVDRFGVPQLVESTERALAGLLAGPGAAPE
jgi:glycosyltransferase involved in cell wall biosynthesis